MTAPTGCHTCGGGAGRHDEAAHSDWPAEVDTCDMPTGYGLTCPLPGDHDEGCEMPLPRCKCSHGPSVHTGGYGRCWQMPCCCEKYRDPQETTK